MTMKNVIEQGPVQARYPEYLTDKNIEAVSLAELSFERVKPKNPNISFKWVNWKAHDGERRMKALFQGFVDATPADCEVCGIAPTNGVFKMQDVILMKIDRRKYEGALKHNAITSMQRISGEGAAKAIVDQLAAQPGASNYVDRGKLAAYEPTNSEKEKLVGKG